MSRERGQASVCVMFWETVLEQTMCSALPGGREAGSSCLPGEAAYPLLPGRAWPLTGASPPCRRTLGRWAQTRGSWRWQALGRHMDSALGRLFLAARLSVSTPPGKPLRGQTGVSEPLG